MTQQTTNLPQVTFPPPRRRPCFICYDAPFLVGKHRYKEGVYYHFTEEETDTAGNVTELPVTNGSVQS